MLRLIIVALMLIHPTNLGEDWECNAEEWHFLLSDYEAESVFVEFESETVIEVPLEKVTGNMSHYTLITSTPTLSDTWTYVPQNWSGTFVISHGPCNGGTDVSINSFREKPHTAEFLLGIMLIFITSVLITWIFDND